MAGWRDEVENLPLETRIKALLVFELASDRAAGQPVDVASRALRAVAVAEGIDSTHGWIDGAAAEIAGGPVPGPRQEEHR